MKIIFLDFDGVVNAFNEPETLRQLSPKCIAVLNDLIEKTDAEIVITSTWRRTHSLADLRQILINAGFRFPRKIRGRTPISPGKRGAEIKAWLDGWPKHSHQEIESFVILDDDSDMGTFMDRLVKIDSDTGLTDADVEKALKMLK